MSKNDDLKAYWSEDSGDEGSGKIDRVIRRDTSLYGRREAGTIFIPDDSTTGDGDHIIAHALLLYMIASFKGDTIRSMPETMHRTFAGIIPDYNSEAKDAMWLQFDKYRSIRKDTTALMRASALSSAIAKADETKLRLKSDTQNIIQEQLLASTAEIFRVLNVTLPKERKKGAIIPSDLKKDGRERDAMNRLIEFDDLLTTSQVDGNFIRADGQSGNTRGNILAGLFNVEFTSRQGYQDASGPSRNLLIEAINGFKTGTISEREYTLTKVSECIFDLFDYVRTGKADVLIQSKKSDSSTPYIIDDELLLYKSLATLTTIVFSVFKNLKTLPSPQQKFIYEELLKQIVEKQGWGKQIIKEEGREDVVIDGRKVVDKDGTETELTKEILKERIGQFAKIDFEVSEESTTISSSTTVEIRMLRNDEPRDGSPFQYCPSRKKFIDDIEATKATPIKSGGEKPRRSNSTSGKLQSTSSNKKLSKKELIEENDQIDFLNPEDQGDTGLEGGMDMIWQSQSKSTPLKEGTTTNVVSEIKAQSFAKGETVEKTPKSHKDKSKKASGTMGVGLV